MVSGGEEHAARVVATGVRAGGALLLGLIAVVWGLITWASPDPVAREKGRQVTLWAIAGCLLGFIVITLSYVVLSAVAYSQATAIP